jgi:hypothetical protein
MSERFDKLHRGAVRKWTDDERKAAAASGEAMRDGSYPIRTRADLLHAVDTFDNATDKEAAQTHITSRAKAIGATDCLPANWPDSTRPADKAALDIGVDALIKLSHQRPLPYFSKGT